MSEQRGLGPQGLRMSYTSARVVAVGTEVGGVNGNRRSDGCQWRWAGRCCPTPFL